MPWPSPLEMERCRLVWQVSTPSQRQALTRVEGLGSVLYLRMAAAMLFLKARSTLEGWEEALTSARASCGLSGMNFTTLPPRAELGLGFCGPEASLDRILERSARDRDHADVILRRVSRGGSDLEDGASTWEELARDYFTLALAALLANVAVDPLLASQLCWALSRPERPSALRSWPSQKSMASLRKTWEVLSVRDRVELTSVEPGTLWFSQACDLSVTVRFARQCIRSGLGDHTELVASGRRAMGLDHVVGTEDRMHLAEAFVCDPACLDHLFKLSIRQADVKDRLVKVASAATAQSILVARELPEDRVEFAWEDLAKVIFTLILDAMLRRCEELLSRSLLAEEAARLTKAKKNKAKKTGRRRAAEEARSVPARGEEASTPSKGDLLCPWDPVQWFLRNTFVEVAEDAPPRHGRIRSRSASV